MAKLHINVKGPVFHKPNFQEELGKLLVANGLGGGDKRAFTWGCECFSHALDIMSMGAKDGKPSVLPQAVTSDFIIERCDLGVSEWWVKVDAKGKEIEYPFYDITDDIMEFAAPRYYCHTSYRQKRPSGTRISIAETYIATPYLKGTVSSLNSLQFIFENVNNAPAVSTVICNVLKYAGFESPKDFTITIP